MFCESETLVNCKSKQTTSRAASHRILAGCWSQAVLHRTAQKGKTNGVKKRCFVSISRFPFPAYMCRIGNERLTLGHIPSQFSCANRLGPLRYSALTRISCAMSPALARRLAQRGLCYPLTGLSQRSSFSRTVLLLERFQPVRWPLRP